MTGAGAAVVSVDAGMCCGTGNCAVVAPGVFQIDERGRAHVLQVRVSGQHRELAERAEQECPCLAIALHTEPAPT